MAKVSPTIETPRVLSRTTRVRFAEWDPIRGTHQGQRSDAPRKQAGHKTASDQTPLTKNVLLCRSHPHRTSCIPRASQTIRHLTNLRIPFGVVPKRARLKRSYDAEAFQVWVAIWVARPVSAA